MKIDVSIDTSELVRRAEITAKQTAYATVNAINATAKQVQEAEFEHVRRKFIVRKPGFLFGTPARPGGVAARIKPFASVRDARPFAVVQTGAEAVGDKHRVLLPQFETGGERQPTTPTAKRATIPLLGRPARPSIRSSVPYEYTFAGMKLTAYVMGKRQVWKRRHRKTTGIGLYDREGGALKLNRAFEAARAAGSEISVQYKGRNRTFLLTKSKGAPEGGVFQRIGPKRGDVRMIYAFRSSVELDARLEYHATAQAAADRWYRQNLEREITKAIEYSRSRGR